MPTHMPTLKAVSMVVLLVVLMAAWVEEWNLPAAAAQRRSRPPAPVPQTGVTFSLRDGDDGQIQAGVPFPTPRFTDRGDGTVRDNLTGLRWLKNAGCFEATLWEFALRAANTLAAGECGLTDGSAAGEWRLPNVRELHSLLHFGFARPALANAAGTAQWTQNDAFVNVQSSEYWSSSTEADIPESFSWSVNLGNGTATVHSRADFARVWPVRGGR
jgi:hypothetical protein